MSTHYDPNQPLETILVQCEKTADNPLGYMRINASEKGKHKLYDGPEYDADGKVPAPADAAK